MKNEPNKGAFNGPSYNNLSKKIDKIVLDFNLKDKINIYESILR